VSGGLAYLDSSAIIKLVFDEPETTALASFLRDWPIRVSSVVARVEVLRTARRVGDSIVTRHAQQMLRGVHMIRIDDSLLAAAAEFEPAAVRTLDAIHLATALSLGSELAGIVVYDRNLRTAARSRGITVWSPS
jgi:uncharacterized protein